MANFFGQLVGSVFELVDMFGAIATAGPLSAILMIVGGLVFAVSVGVFGVLTLGAVLDLFKPESLGRAPRRPE